MVLSGRADTSPGVAALQCATLVLAQTSPHTVILPGFQCPCWAPFANITALAHHFGLFDLKQSRAGVTDGEEEFGIFVEACAAVTPVHAGHSFRVMLYMQLRAFETYPLVRASGGRCLPTNLHRLCSQDLRPCTRDEAILSLLDSSRDIRHGHMIACGDMLDRGSSTGHRTMRITRVVTMQYRRQRWQLRLSCGPKRWY